MSSLALQQLPPTERPRERLVAQGPEALSNAELIAIILGSGIRGKSVLHLAQELLAQFGSLENLTQATLEELQQVKGLGIARTLQLLAAFSLASRVSRSSPNLLHRMDTPQQAYLQVGHALAEEKRELFLVLLLDVRLRLICSETVAVGTLSHILVHPREVFYPAIRHKASSLLLVHNHPSGDPTPSPQDLKLTSVLVEAGRLIGIPVRDHIVVGRGAFVSLREEGLSFD